MEIQSLRDVRTGIGAEFGKAVSLMLERLKTGGKIVTTGIGKSLHVAEKISATLSSTGSPSVSLNPAQAAHGDLGILNKNDALLVFSYSGESDELTTLIPIVKRMGTPIVSITGNRKSTLATNSNIVLIASVRREACPFNMAPTCSTTAALVMGDALAMTLLDARGFRREDYARLHPGGAIGRALLLRVKDIMRTGPRLATVGEQALVKEALLAMTKARSGSVGIISKNGKLKGIFTDGDLRRYMFKSRDILNTPVKDIMTKSPITVTADRLAIDVLSLFEEHSIDDIMVLDPKRQLVGCIDIQDLPKLKIL